MADKKKLEGMTKDMLLDIAKQKQIEVPSKATKSDIVNLIMENDEVAKEGVEFCGER